MAKPLVAVIAPGAMGSAVGARLVERGIDVITSLVGRSRSSIDRAERSGMRAVPEAEIAKAAFILSIVPPSEALGLADRLAPILSAARARPLYIDCNAVSSATVTRISTVITASGAPFADAGIIGGPPKAGYDGPSIYVCGVTPDKLAPLSEAGLKIRHLDGPVGSASALKMSYASITKGLTGIATASILAASRYGAADALHAELAASQKAILAAITRAVPDMFQKAYRFVGEMEEIGAHSERASTAAIYGGLAKLYQEIADDLGGPKRDIAALESFFKSK
jgi:L-threonate 2-dehydrogenase